MFGIINGIDQELWDPSIDEFLPRQYGPEDVAEGKGAARRELRRRGQLGDIDVPLVRRSCGSCCCCCCCCCCPGWA
jgi:starch synthase